jgi:SSS family solute:Na+ symporter
MITPFLIIVPGMITIALAHTPGSGFVLPRTDAGGYDYNMTTPAMFAYYLPNGLLGIGLAALLASFMSGMSGNVTAFNTVWTYDIYRSYLAKHGTDAHYLAVGRWATVAGVMASIGIAYGVRRYDNIMDPVQLVFAFVNAPLFATFLLGMFWRRTTGHAAFLGLLIGTLAAAIHHGLSLPIGETVGLKGGWLGTVQHTYPSGMAQNFWTAIYAWTSCFAATVLISLVTPQKKTEAELRGLVYSLTPTANERVARWWLNPVVLGSVVLVAAVLLNIVFW